MEPILCNTSVIPPAPGFLETVRELTAANGTVLIFDEVITGFRVGPGGAQQRLGVTPDLAVFAKAMASGYPIAALAGRRDLMELTRQGRAPRRHLQRERRRASQPRTRRSRSSRPAATSLYARIERAGERLMDGLRAAARAAGVEPDRPGPRERVQHHVRRRARCATYREYVATDLACQRRFLVGLQDRGVRVTGRGTWFLSSAHTDADIDRTIDAAAETLGALAEAPAA